MNEVGLIENEHLISVIIKKMEEEILKSWNVIPETISC